MANTEREIPFRVTLLHPPPGAIFWLQCGKADLVPPTKIAEDEVSLEGTLRVGRKADGSPNFLGPFAQGPPAGRFLYVNSPGRRAKVPLGGITQELIEQALASPGSVLEARIAGRAKDGGCACASVPLLDGGWKVGGS
jgi:hypothetical protein